MDKTIIREQYEEYPYPIRDPENDKKGLFITGGEFLEEINHWLFKGKESFQRRFRILVAGGGTGDAVIFLSEQLKLSNAEIVYLDFSKASLEIAKRRAKIRGLKNIQWVHESILNLPKLHLGKFDYITCTGVLHHLESPPEGLNALKEVLSERGGMLIMLYGKIGRTGVYQIQDLLRYVNEGATSKAEEISIGKTVIDELPDTNWFSRGKELAQDYLYSDSGFYDLFLHKQDRAYTIPEVYEFVHNAGLHLIDFSCADDRLAMNIATHIKNPTLLQRIQSMDLIKQQAICELLCGTVIRHGFYISKQTDPKASFEDLNNIPYFFVPSAIPKQILEFIDKHRPQPGDVATATLQNELIKQAKIQFSISIYTAAIFRQMLSETKTLKEIFEGVRKELKQEIPNETLIKEMQTLLKPFIFLGVLVLRDKGASPNYIRPNWNPTTLHLQASPPRK